MMALLLCIGINDILKLGVIDGVDETLKLGVGGISVHVSPLPLFHKYPISHLLNTLLHTDVVSIQPINADSARLGIWIIFCLLSS